MVKVKVSKSAVQHFRQCAREAVPKEIQAMLVGRVVSPTLTVIDRIEYTREYSQQTASGVSWSRIALDKLDKKLTESGEHLVGDLHSHNEWDAVLSPTDHAEQIKAGYRIGGICSINGKKTRIRFWITESALPAKIVYV